MIYDNPRTGSFNELCPRSLRYILKLLFLKKTLGRLKPNSYGASMGCWDVNLFKFPGHMTKMASSPIYGKTLQKSLSLEPRD